MNITIILLILVLGALLLDTMILIKLSKSLDKMNKGIYQEMANVEENLALQIDSVKENIEEKIQWEKIK